jgi:hypothetical protein
MRRGYRRSGLSNLGSVLKGSLDSLGLRHKVAEQQAAEKWREVVGPQIAGVTFVESVRDGVLFVSCKSSMWASELTLHTPDILKKLEKAVGRKVITDIRFGARGFKRRSSQDESKEDEFEPETVQLTEDEKEEAAKAAAQVDAMELAEKIERAVLAGKRRKKAMM